MNNEIIHLESGKWPTSLRVKKAQLKFWIYLQEYKDKFPDAALSKMLQIGMDNRLTYLKYYENLKSIYGDPENCRISIEREYFEQVKT